MGTNYYALRKPTELDKQAIKDAVDAEDWLEAKRLIPSVVHIGKSSAGWQFIFDHSNWENFDKTLESLEAFLKKSVIEDEYGKAISYTEFWEMVNSKKSGLDGREYYTNWEKYNKDWQTDKPLPRPAYIPHNYGEEKHFGLTFADSTDFS